VLVENGTRFAVFPLDERVSWRARTKGARWKGPFTAVGDKVPVEDDPLHLDGGPLPSPRVVLGSDEKQLLESLGYIQEDEAP
jgi:hypothetical protein